MSQRMVGTTQRILVSGASKKDSSEFCGYTDNNRMVSFVGSGAQSATGHFINVKIATAMARSLRGELCSPSV
jgi:tRNA-2-methylthio-N6-dimethylallyladenosine synthase